MVWWASNASHIGSVDIHDKQVMAPYAVAGEESNTARHLTKQGLIYPQEGLWGLLTAFDWTRRNS